MRCESLPIDVDMKTKYILSWILCFAIVSTVSCSGNDPAFPTVTENPSTDPGTNPGTDPGTDTTDATVPAGSALYFRLGMKWESAAETAAFTNLNRAESGDCIVTSVTPDITCSFAIPEGQLYHSILQFRMGSKAAASCPILKFSPYYYRKSSASPVADDAGTPADETAPGYNPAGGDAELSCADGKEPLCYGGAAPHMVEGFPKNTGHYFLPQVTPETSYTLNSENKLRSYYGAGVNYLVTNDLPTLDRAANANAPADIATSRERVGNTFNDYYIWCETFWAEPVFSIKVMISDENVDPDGGLDQYPDWPGVNN